MFLSNGFPFIGRFIISVSDPIHDPSPANLTKKKAPFNEGKVSILFVKRQTYRNPNIHESKSVASPIKIKILLESAYLRNHERKETYDPSICCQMVAGMCKQIMLTM